MKVEEMVTMMAAKVEEMRVEEMKVVPRMMMQG
jgi:hypothetical protein